ncbi:MAG: BREX system P-loop protein BrxC [bacterium]|nr:BREX system P-loop protein BrxC [bacterium]
MKIHEILDRDPRNSGLANNGQARITGLMDERANTELRAELETFVCDGQYGDAIQRILSNYLTNLDRPRQSAAWVSGFFGSGKSHLLKMLGHLWVNTQFADGSTARNLVRGLPADIEAQLKELDTEATRSGKTPIAAAGTLPAGSGDHVRRTILSIILQATGWPDQYAQARFCFWLRDEGLLEAVRADVEAAGRSWLKELNNLYVSPFIAKAILKASPGFAENEAIARKILIQQYPQSGSDITTPQFIEAARKALSEDDDLPLTILVLDEVQQYISDASDRAVMITETAEAIQTQLDSRVMLVASGQSALTSTPNLQRLRDRFTITSQLSDADVEAVTRKVLLLKKASANTKVEKLLEDHAGETDRHLKGTKIGPQAEDRKHRVADYPLLPTRRRFWEECFRTVDAEGANSQLRSQLRIIHDSLQKVAATELGTVIPSSDLFHVLAPDLVNKGVLLNEISTRIQRLNDDTADGALKQSLCGLIFLIGKLPREDGVNLGVRADASTLADLEINDLTQNSGPFRKNVEKLLDELVADTVVMKVGDEYRLQTTEGAEWDRSFREKQQTVRPDEIEIARVRENLFGQEVRKIVDQIKIFQGKSKVKRTLALHFGDDAPAPGGQHVAVWLRDGWQTSQKEAESQARQMGAEDPTLHVHLPKKSADDLKARIVDVEAARKVLEQNGTPGSPEGKEARASMESRQKAAEQSRDTIVREIIRAAKVYQGGGTEVFGESLRDKVDEGAEQSLVRLFPRFDDADSKAWEAAVKRAKDGSDEPFKVVGWERPTEEHPVAKEVLNVVGTGAKGSEVQKELKGGKFGWPQDAIDAALIALHRSDHLRATKNGQPIHPGQLDQAGIKAAEFRPQAVRLSATQKIAIRGLYQYLADIKCKTGEEEQKAPLFLNELEQLAKSAGGEPPLPATPDLALVDELKGYTGNEQLQAMLDKQDDLKTTVKGWKTLAGRSEARMPIWQLAVRLRELAADLPIVDEVGPELNAIKADRSLLANDDLVMPLNAKLGESLRAEATRVHDLLTKSVDRALKDLESDANWSELNGAVRTEVARKVGIAKPAPLSVATNEDLCRTLENQSLNAMRAEIDAVPARVPNALLEAAKRQDPSKTTTPVTVRRCTLASADEVSAWVKEQEEKLMAAVAKGPVIIN